MREPAVVAALVGVHVLVVDADLDTRELLDAVLSYCGAFVTRVLGVPAQAHRSLGALPAARRPGRQGVVSSLGPAARQGAEER
jgi:hypothetical protein